MIDRKRRGEHGDCIERIVRDVLARLGGSHALTGTGSKDGTDVTDHQDGGKRQPSCRMLTQRVITVDALEGKLEGVREVRVDHGAVVTPAAQDVLRRADVRLVREGRANRGARQKAGSLIVGVADCADEPAAVTRLTEVHRGGIDHIARTGLVDVVEGLTEQVVFGGSKGLLFTDNAAAAICLANRGKGVRAVTERSFKEVEAAVAAVGANLLVIRPAGLTTWEQLRMVTTLTACRDCCRSEIRVALG